MDAISTTSLIPGNGSPLAAPAFAGQSYLARAQSSPDRYLPQNGMRFGKGPKGFGLKSFGLKNKENKRVIWGYALRYGSPVVALALGFISGPLACCVVPLSLLGLWFAEKKGTELIKGTNKKKLSGIPKHTEHVRHIWEETKLSDIKKKGDKPYKDIRKHYNAIVNTVVSSKSMRRRLQLKPKKPLDRLIQKMFYVQVIYRKHPLGKGIHGMRKLSSKPFFRFPLFRYPLLFLSWTLQLFLTLIASGKAQRLIKKAAK